MAETRFKFGYWKIRGLGACCRMLLWYCGERDFEDRMYEQGDPPALSRQEWYDEKYTLGLDFPNLPYLFDRVKGLGLTQTMAILEHVSRELKPELLTGSGRDAPRLTMVLNFVMDLHSNLSSYFYRASEDEAKRMREEVFPTQLALLEKYLEKAEGPFLGGHLTYADFYVAEELDHAVELIPGFLDEFPSVKAYWERFFALPEIVAFRASPHHCTLVNNKVAKMNNFVFPAPAAASE